jgi:hypothetical protein
VPELVPAAWRLYMHGMVERELLLDQHVRSGWQVGPRGEPLEGGLAASRDRP